MSKIINALLNGINSLITDVLITLFEFIGIKILNGILVWTIKLVRIERRKKH